MQLHHHWDQAHHHHSPRNTLIQLDSWGEIGIDTMLLPHPLQDLTLQGIHMADATWIESEEEIGMHLPEVLVECQIWQVDLLPLKALHQILAIPKMRMVDTLDRPIHTLNRTRYPSGHHFR